MCYSTKFKFFRSKHSQLQTLGFTPNSGTAQQLAGFAAVPEHAQWPFAWFGSHSRMLAHDFREENFVFMEYLMKSIYKNFIKTCVIFRDESNDDN